MNLFDEIVRRGCYNYKAFVAPKSREGERQLIGQGEVVRLRANILFSFEKSISWNQTTARLESILERGQVVSSLRSGVD